MLRATTLVFIGMWCACACNSGSRASEAGRASRDAAIIYPTQKDGDASVGLPADSGAPRVSLIDGLLRDSPRRDAGVDASAETVAFVVNPQVIQNPETNAPLVFVANWETNTRSWAEVFIEGGEESWTLEISEPTARHERPLFGLKPATSYQGTVRVSDGFSETTVELPGFTTPGLPDDFPPIVAAVSEPELMEPGMTLLNLREPTESMVIVDHSGQVRWYFDDPDNGVRTDHRRMKNGNFLFEKDHRVIIEVDPLGRIVDQWHAANHPVPFDVAEGSIPVAVDTFHHEISDLTEDTFLTLSSELREVANYPTSDSDPDAPTATQTIIGQVIVEFNRSGAVEREVSLLDLLDPTRIGRGSLRDNWAETYGAGKKDWGHSNAVVYDANSDCYIVSVRQQDAIVAINRTEVRVEWILGTHANWRKPWSDLLLEPEGEIDWPFHAHGVESTAGGIAAFDNGNFRAPAFETNDTPAYSRGVIYDVDPSRRTVRQTFSYGAPDSDAHFYAGSMGDADWQEKTGNLLITSGVMSNGSGGFYGQVLEVTPEGRRVFELDLGWPRGGGVDTEAYRAQRLPDIRFANY